MLYTLPFILLTLFLSHLQRFFTYHMYFYIDIFDIFYFEFLNFPESFDTSLKFVELYELHFLYTLSQRLVYKLFYYT